MTPQHSPDHVPVAARNLDYRCFEIPPVVTNESSAFAPGDGWHSDVTCDEIPPLGSMLYLRETPSPDPRRLTAILLQPRRCMRTATIHGVSLT